MGFDPYFVEGCEIPLPTLSPRLKEFAFRDGEPVDHTRFSLIFSSSRGFAFATAHNIDGATIIPAGVIAQRSQFRFDPQVPSALQVDNERGYFQNPYDRGHLVRRRALHWGNEQIARRADAESYYWTNIAPQHERLNRTAWARIEEWMLALADDNEKQASVFTGPVLTDDDVTFQNQPDELPIRLPGGFWKVIAIKHEAQLRAAAFLVWQRDFDGVNPVDFDPVLEQVRISTIEYLTGLSFGSLRSVDPLRFGTGLALPVGREPARTRTRRQAAITCREDIVM